MNLEKIEVNEPSVEKEPVYYAPKRVTLAADLAGIISWVVLVGFLAYFVVEVIYVRAQMVDGALSLASLIKEPSFLSYLFSNLIIPLLTGLGLFFLLQAAATGLNVLLEADLVKHEREGSPKA